MEYLIPFPPATSRVQSHTVAGAATIFGLDELFDLDVEISPALRAQDEARSLARTPWLYDLNKRAERHLHLSVIPTLMRRHCRRPRWSVMGARLDDGDISHHGALLTPILALGTELVHRVPMPLFERKVSIFNYSPAKPVLFDEAAFDAGIALAIGPDADFTFDLTPVVSGFERMLLAQRLKSFDKCRAVGRMLASPIMHPAIR